ncbi:hypothetical protein HC723_16420 [Vibrio sp. S11_S32]|uniref:hypothetical protein n=1 Tax=Vibrio sp. S11_S32 TaxID=2720225 RepID=UPI00168146CF|nr:hypothetical protein [Vibrio sp. S11_S32]MBD1577975.1 hypothetical protein [Vibrio sp. S11_S32]
MALSLQEYLFLAYGSSGGDRQPFYEENPEFFTSEIARWIKGDYKIDLDTGEIYKPVSKSPKLIDIKKNGVFKQVAIDGEIAQEKLAQLLVLGDRGLEQRFGCIADLIASEHSGEVKLFYKTGYVACVVISINRTEQIADVIYAGEEKKRRRNDNNQCNQIINFIRYVLNDESIECRIPAR